LKYRKKRSNFKEIRLDRSVCRASRYVVSGR
jgi:hypothetical protein